MDGSSNVLCYSGPEATTQEIQYSSYVLNVSTRHWTKIDIIESLFSVNLQVSGGAKHFILPLFWMRGGSV